MLARKYDYYESQEWREEQPKVTNPKPKRPLKKNNYRLLRRRLFVSVGLLLVMYSVAVVRSETLVRTGGELIDLKQTEAQLISKNSELRIEVEELKGPERITGIAEKQLGMSVARNNIYVKAGTR